MNACTCVYDVSECVRCVSLQVHVSVWCICVSKCKLVYMGMHVGVDHMVKVSERSMHKGSCYSRVPPPPLVTFRDTHIMLLKYLLCYALIPNKPIMPIVFFYLLCSLNLQYSADKIRENSLQETRSL